MTTPDGGPAPATDRTLRGPSDLDALSFDDRGLVPVVAQHAGTGAVLMVAWADREALVRTLESGEVWFWSRSRGQLWRKGETSGNTLQVVSVHADCDGDTVLARVRPAGPACHTGERTCFGEGADPTLAALAETLRRRAVERPEGSYTVRLLDDPNLRTKKLGEETAELIRALVQGDADRAAEEAADLFYHVLVALLAEGGSPDAVLEALEGRR
ncbi:MAG: bifunctional phosphoribosyl-AMP cyclohydrolase/phosphoribosyl-ATP diphosphatase HisIE [Longimicrobiales bacterium]|nr:bifunctional phosphoribosyl-AMP cyclohydrolase/phosphoribosyl-ATP diphosphatase HisIE [Longimicrobiales bacterium]